MRLTSPIVRGSDWAEWPERTMNSDSTPAMWALRYSTTPSSPVSTGPSPRPAMMECALTPGTMGVRDRLRTSGLPGVMAWTLPNPCWLRSPAVTPSIFPISVVAFRISMGMRTRPATNWLIRLPAT